jgi:uncharacterized RDD family membrane protein YckC
MVGKYGGFFSRAVAFIIDIVIISVTNFVLYWLVNAVVVQFIDYSIDSCPPITSFNLLIITCNVANWSMIAFTAVFPLIYFLFFWILTGQTLGDFAAGIRVVRANGRRMNLVTVALRLLGYFVCIITFGLGFLWVLVDDRRQGWHDKIARTYVIYAWEARQNEKLVRRLNKRLYGKTQSL